MSAIRCTAILVATLALTSCNAVFGLDEGELADGGSAANGDANGGGGQGTGGVAIGGEGSGGDPQASATSSTGGGGEGGEGGAACVLDTGLANGDFELWGGSDPADWSKYAFNTMVALSTAMFLTDGISIGLSDVGAGAYGGVYQTVAFIDWNDCVRLSGDAKKSSGMGRLRALVTFDGDEIDLTLPGGGDFESFSFTCQPTQTVTTFNFKLEVDQVPTGGTVTVQSHGVAFDHVCCEVDTPPCP